MYCERVLLTVILEICMGSKRVLSDAFTLIKNNKDFIFIILLSIIFLSRILYLDADAKSYKLVTGIPGDEIYYNEIAINIYHNGFTGLISGSCGDVTLANAKNFLIPNIVTGISFKIFGLNFYGLRIPYVVMGLISLLLLFYCAKYCFEDNKILTYGITILFLFDFSVLLVSRYALTVIPCMLAAIIYFSGYILLRDYRKFQLFFLGFWPVLALCLIYSYMAFMVIAGFALLIFTITPAKLSIKEKMQDLSCYICGIIAGISICEMSSLVVFNEHLTSLLLDVFYAHCDKIIEPSALEVVFNYVYNAISYLISNPFRYNYFILLFTLFSTILYICLILNRYKNGEQLDRDLLQPAEWFIILMIGCYWLQNIFLPNLTMTKATITMPFVLLFIGYGIDRWKSVKSSLNDKQKKIALVIAIILSVICLIGLIILHLHLAILPPLLIVFFTIICIITAVTAIYYLGFSKTEKPLIGIFSITIIFSITLAGIFVYSDNTYTDKYVCKDVYNVIGDAPVIGGHSKGFYLYEGNNLNVLVQEYDHYHGVGYDWDYVYQKIYNATLEHDDIYFFGYAEGLGIYEMDIAYINSYVLNNTPYQYEPVKIYERRVDNGKYNVAVYKKVKRAGADGEGSGTLPGTTGIYL